jgi:hypothetical protein
MSEINTRFVKDMLGIYLRARDEEGYIAFDFYSMLGRDGAFKTAMTLVNRLTPSIGFLKLCELNRIDLTVEALITGDQDYRSLFDEQTLKTAEQRIRAFERDSKT